MPYLSPFQGRRRGFLDWQIWKKKLHQASSVPLGFSHKVLPICIFSLMEDSSSASIWVVSLIQVCIL